MCMAGVIACDTECASVKSNAWETYLASLRWITQFSAISVKRSSLLLQLVINKFAAKITWRCLDFRTRGVQCWGYSATVPNAILCRRELITRRVWRDASQYRQDVIHWTKFPNQLWKTALLYIFWTQWGWYYDWMCVRTQLHGVYAPTCV